MVVSTQEDYTWSKLLLLGSLFFYWFMNKYFCCKNLCGGYFLGWSKRSILETNVCNFHLATLFPYQDDGTGRYSQFNHRQLLVKLEGLSVCCSCFGVYGSCISCNMEAWEFKELHIWQRRKPAREGFVWWWSMETMP